MIVGIRMGWGVNGAIFSSICAKVAWLGAEAKVGHLAEMIEKAQHKNAIFSAIF